MSEHLSPVAAAIKARRQELIEKPLSRIYEDLAEAAVHAYVKERNKQMEQFCSNLETLGTELQSAWDNNVDALYEA